MAREIITSFRIGRKRKNRLRQLFFSVNRSWRNSSINDEVETTISNQRVGGWKPKIPAIKRVRTRPRTRFNLLIFLDRATPKIMPRIIADE